MGFLDSAIRAIFTPPGTNAANAQNNRNASAAKLSLEFLQGIAPLIRGGVSGLLPSMTGQDAMNTAQLFARNWSSMMNQFGNAVSQSPMATAAMARSGALQQAVNANRMYSASNPADASLRQALNISGINSANRAYADALQSALSPEGQAQRLQNLAQTSGALYANSPVQLQSRTIGELLNIFNQLASAVYGQPQVKVGTGLGDILGQVAASWAGSGFKVPTNKPAGNSGNS